MDKTQGIGVLLLFIVFAGYFYLTAPSEAEVAEAQRVQDSIALVKAQETGVPTAPIQAQPQSSTVLPSDSVQVAALSNKYGDFGNAMVGEEQTVSLENSKVKLTLSSKGGVITEASIKDHFKITEDEEHNLSLIHI